MSNRVVRHFSALLLLLGFLFVWEQPRVYAATGILKQINFQGKVVTKTTGTNIADGDYSFTFTIYDASSAGTNLWTETKTITVTNGIFQTLLGSVTTMPSSIDFNTDNLYLGINFNSDGEMSPRVRLAAVPQAFNAQKVAGLTVTDTTGTLTIPSGKTISFADAFTTSGANALTLTTTASTNVTLPTTGTLSTLAGSETLTNKTIGSTGLLFENSESISNGTDGTISLGRNDAGTVTLLAKDNDANADLSVKSGGTGALTLDSTSTGTVGLGTSNNAKIINIGTGTAGNTFNIGTDNTTKDTINIGSALDDVAITGDQWSISNAGVLTVVSCTGCGGGASTLQGAYDGTSGNTILTTTGRNIAFTLGEVASPTSLTLENQDTAGTTAFGLSNSIASGTLTNGLLIDQTGAGTMTNAIKIIESAGTITDGILISGTLGNILNTDSIDISGAGAITGATGVSTTTVTASSTVDLNGDVQIADTNVAFDGASTILTATGAFTLTPGGAFVLGATGQTATLQGSTVSITSTGAGNDITLTPADDVLLNPGDDEVVTLSATGNVLYDAATTDNTTNSTTTGVFGLAIDASISGASSTNLGFYLDYQAIDDADATDSFVASRIDFTNSSGDAGDTTVALSLNNANDASGAATDALLSLENNDANTAVTSGIGFYAGGANAPDFTSGIDFSGGASFTNEMLLSNGQVINGTDNNDINFTDNGITLNIDFGEDTASAVSMQSTSQFSFGSTANGAGAVTFGASQGGIIISALGASAGEDITISATGSSISLTSTESVTDAIMLDASVDGGAVRIIAGDNEATTIADGNDIELKAEDDAIVSLTAAGQFRIDAGTNVDSTVASAGTVDVVIDASPASAGTNYGVHLDYQAINDANANQTQIGMRIDYTNSEDAAGDTSFVLSLNNANDASGAATDAILTLENNDANTAVGAGIQFLAGGANAPDFTYGLDFDAADFTTEIRMENAETIDNQTDGRITITATTIAVTGLASCDTIDTDVNGVLSCGTDAGAGAGAANLQEAYDGDANGSDAVILMTSTDGSIIFQTVAGTQFQVAASAAPTVDLVAFTNAGQGTVTDGVDGLEVTFVQADDADATDTNAGLRLSLTSSSGDADTLVGMDITNITGGTATEKAIRIGSGYDTDIEFVDTTPQIRLADATALSFVEAGGGFEIAALKEYFSSANYGVFEANGFINIDGSFYTDNFSNAQVQATADATGTGRYGDKFGWIFDEAGTYAVGVGSNAAGSYGCAINQARSGLTTNSFGLLEIAPDLTTSTAGVRGADCRLSMGNAVGAATAAVLNVANKWVMYWKVRPSAAWTNAKTARAMYFGANNYSMAWDGTIPYGTSANPAQAGGAIHMYNGDPTNGNLGSVWSGIVASGTLSNRTTVNCGVSVVTNAFALLRIEARATNDVGFYVDPDVSNGVPSFTSCGAATVNVPTVNLGPAVNIGNSLATGQSASGAWTAEIDLFAFVQDDPKGGGTTQSAMTEVSTEIAHWQQSVDPISGADLAENYYFDGDYQIGDIVVLSGSPGHARLATFGYDRKILGVISDSPGLLIGAQAESAKPVALTGRVPTRVNLLGGQIRIGDPITSSDIPGVGMRAKGPGKIVGTAMQDFTCDTGEDCVGTIMVNINPGYYLGDEAGIKLLEQKQLLSIDKTSSEAARLEREASESASLGIDSGLTDGVLTRMVEFAKGMRVVGFFENAGTALFKGSTEFLSSVLFSEKVSFQRQVTFSSDSAGVAVVRKGQRFVDVSFTKEYDTTPIVNANLTIPKVTEANKSEYVVKDLCVLEDTISGCQDKVSNATLAIDLRYAVVSTSKQGFMILLNGEAPSDMTYNWTAVAVQDTKVTESNGVSSPSPASTVLPTVLPSIIPTLFPSPTPTPLPVESMIPLPTPLPLEVPESSSSAQLL